MKYLIDKPLQEEIAEMINEAANEAIAEMDNHLTEEGLTPVLGSKLMAQRLRTADVTVVFSYRQLNKQTEEPPAGADGGFLVRIQHPEGIAEKASLFQAKRLPARKPIRDLSMNGDEAMTLKSQAEKMLRQTEDAVGVFYTRRGVYVVDAKKYAHASPSDLRQPLSDTHRVVTLGTYLGSWMARCTKGDTTADFVNRVRHLDGFRNGITMSVVTGRPAVPWGRDEAVEQWSAEQSRRRKK